METYISLLRGINLSGQKKILMDDLKALYKKMGFHDVQTYIQSGDDEFVASEKTIYVFCPNGAGRTKLSNNFFEKKLKTIA